jgi:hypothetical protein
MIKRLVIANTRKSMNHLALRLKQRINLMLIAINYSMDGVVFYGILMDETLQVLTKLATYKTSSGRL